MGGHGIGPTNEQIAEALRQSHGMVYIAAESIHCSPNTIKARAKKFKWLQDVIDDSTEILIDRTELKLEEAIKAREPWAIKYFLSTKGKERGYVQRIEQTGKDGGPQKVYYGFDTEKV